MQLADGRSAAGVVLADDALRRRKVGIISGRAEGEAQDLVDPLHYLRQALEPFAEVIEAPLAEMLNAAPDVLILADVGTLGAGRAGGARCPGSRRAGCWSASPGRGWRSRAPASSRTTRCCRCGCAPAAGRSAARCPGARRGG